MAKQKQRIDYDRLHVDEFDAVVTGELTHVALGLEVAIDNFLARYFGVPASRILDFRRLFLERDGLTFQGKVEIARGTLGSLEPSEAQTEIKALLVRAEKFQASRNALAHGRDGGSKASPLTLCVSTVSRSGREQDVEISPESHRTMMADGYGLVDELDAAFNNLLKKAKPHD